MLKGTEVLPQPQPVDPRFLKMLFQVTVFTDGTAIIVDRERMLAK